MSDHDAATTDFLHGFDDCEWTYYVRGHEIRFVGAKHVSPAGFSLRTYPDCSPLTAVGTSESCLERWPTSGMAWRGGLSTAVSSECRSADGACSSSEPSLTEILEPPQNVSARYSLSAKAAAGILRRAQKRGRTLPPHLEEALARVAGTTAIPSTGGGHSSLSGLGNGGPDDNDAQAGRLVVSDQPFTFDWQAGGSGDESFRGKSRQWIDDKPGGPARSLVKNKTLAVAIPEVAAPLTKGSATGEGVNAPGRRQEDDVNIVAYPISGDALRAGDAKTPSPDAEGKVRLRDPGLGIGDEGDPAFTPTKTHPGAP